MTFKSENVTCGRDCVGRIILTDRGFEIFDAADRYIFTCTTLPEARRALFERHRNESADREGAE